MHKVFLFPVGLLTLLGIIVGGVAWRSVQVDLTVQRPDLSNITSSAKKALEKLGEEREKKSTFSAEPKPEPEKAGTKTELPAAEQQAVPALAPSSSSATLPAPEKVETPLPQVETKSMADPVGLQKRGHPTSVAVINSSKGDMSPAAPRELRDRFVRRVGDPAINSFAPSPPKRDRQNFFVRGRDPKRRVCR